MCGIAGWLSFEEDVREKRDALEAMSGTLANRGPDDHGMYITPSAGLVHWRLAVVDIAGGRQPMREGDYTIVYNGELYNTEELRQELAGSGWEFRGHSDTEVLLKAFVQWGKGCLDRLSGIYSFAVWNETQRRLFAARDRVGVKPFFFYEDGHRFIFGSVIPTLTAAAPWCEGLTPRLDEEGRRQLVSDVPLCTMLSGGLDSSILSALAGAEYRKQGKTLHTWSVDYADSSQYFRAGRFVPSEDAPYAAEMAERIGSEHHIVTLDKWSWRTPCRWPRRSGACRAWRTWTAACCCSAVPFGNSSRSGSAASARTNCSAATPGITGMRFCLRNASPGAGAYRCGISFSALRR